MRIRQRGYMYAISALSLLIGGQAQQQFAGLGQPSFTEWQCLNASLSGRLQTLRPWASVCYTSDPSYDSAKCQEVLSAYDNDTLRVQQPGAVLWPNWEACGNGNGCGLNVSNPQEVNGATCKQGTIPPYSIAITSASDASTVVKWAVANDVILTVKSSGHDLSGRAAGPGTLQVNVAQLQNLEYVPQFVPAGSQDPPVPAMIVGGGAHLIDIYHLAESKNVSVALGSCGSIGAGGYFQAGGHGPLSPTLGLGVDNVLEYEIVTADGEIRKVNSAQNSDLFWAVRGGGPGSWGIIISVTMQVYPAMQVGSSQLEIQPNPSQNATELTIQFFELVGKYQNAWMDSGISTGFMPNGTFSALFLWPTNNDSLPLLFPFFDELLSLSDNFTVISNHTAVPMYSSYTEAETSFLAPIAAIENYTGGSTHSASRLVPRSSLTSPESIRQVAEAIWVGHQTMAAIVGSGNPDSLGTAPVFISGNLPGASHLDRINDTGANPALYNAAWHITYTGAWNIVSDERYQDYVSAVFHSIDPLTELGIVGSYQGESNAYEVDWQETFFGYKYSNLTSIKRKYDPMNFFNSWKGVDFVPVRSSYKCYLPNGPDATQTFTGFNNVSVPSAAPTGSDIDV